MNFNININQNTNTLQTKYPKPQKKCQDDKLLYRVTFGYKSRLSGDNIFPVTYENFDESFQKPKKIINPGDLVKYTPQNKKDPNYGRQALVVKVTKRFEKREAQSRGLEVNPDKDKYTFYDIKFVNPIVVQNQIIKDKKQLTRLNKDGSVQLEKMQDEVESYVCEESFYIGGRRDVDSYIQARTSYNSNKNEQNEAVLRGTENRLWNQHFHLDENNEPQYPLITSLEPSVKTRLDSVVENMVKVGFLLGKKEMRPKIKKVKKGFTISFLMPKGANPGDTITIPVLSKTPGKGKMVEIVVKIPIVNERGNTPLENEYIRNVPISQELNSGVYDNLKSMSPSKDVDTKFKPTFIKASDYVGPEKQKDMDLLVKPGSTQEYTISNARIVPQNGNKFTFKKLTSFDKASTPLVFDLYVVVDLTLKLNLKGPEDAANDTFGNKVTRTVTAGILNAPENCAEYMDRAKRGASQLFSTLQPMTEALKNQLGQQALDRDSAAQSIQRLSRERRRRKNIESGRENVRRGGQRKKTRRRKLRKCVRKATKRLNKCWRKKKRSTFKKCWKKGRNKYKSCRKNTRKRK